MKGLFHLMAFVGSVMGQGCSRITTRPEIRDLSPTQLQAYLKATRELHKQGGYMAMSRVHFDSQANAHGVPYFFPWHREYLRRYELALQAIDNSVVLPYWNWSLDSQSPERSRILTEAMFGGNGSGGDMCVSRGSFRNWNSTVPDSHCLRREYDNGDSISPFYSPEALEVILTQAMSYEQLWQTVEGAPHARVHVSIGGDRGDLSFMYSSNDPLFFLHHAFIDLLWHEWQVRNPSMARDFNGSTASGNVTTQDIMVPFGIPVSQALDTRAPGYCYTYPKFRANVPSLPRRHSRFAKRQLDSSLLSFVGLEPSGDDWLDLNFGSTHSVRFFSEPSHGLPSSNSILGPLQHYERVDVPPNDRTVANKIRTCNPIPEPYLLRNNIDVGRVRAFEEKMSALVGIFNALPDFSPSVRLL